MTPIEMLSNNLEVAAALTLVSRMAYGKGFSDATQLLEFCEPAGANDYFPTADSRPTAERMGWPRE